MKEKILLYYEALFQEKYNLIPWQEFYLLKVSSEQLSHFVVSAQAKQNLKLAGTTQYLLVKCLEYLNDEKCIRIVNAAQVEFQFVQ